MADHSQISISFDEKQSSAFEKVTEQYSGEGKRLAIVYGDKILHAPKLKSKIQGKGAVIDFCNDHLYKIVLAILRGEIPQKYDFNADTKCAVCFTGPLETRNRK